MKSARPPFVEFPLLTTARLHLRAIVRADVPLLLPISFFHGKAAQTLAEAYQMQALIGADYAAGTLIHWGIALRGQPDQLVGTVGFYRGFPAETGEIGYVLLPEARGHGYATEAIAAIAQFGFEQLGLRQVVAFADAANASSQAVLRRVGFREVVEPEVATAEPAALRRFALAPPVA